MDWVITRYSGWPWSVPHCVNWGIWKPLQIRELEAETKCNVYVCVCCTGILRSTFRRSQQTPACQSWASRASVSMQPTPTRWSRCSAISRTRTQGFNSSLLSYLARHLSTVSAWYSLANFLQFGFSFHFGSTLISVFWHCLLGNGKGIQLVRIPRQ